MTLILPDRGPLLTPSVEVVRAQIATGYSTAARIASTEAVEETLTIAIPASWNSYDIYVWVSLSIFEDLSSGANDSVILRIRKTNVSGAVWGKQIVEVGTVSPDTAPAGGFVGFAEAETDTGNVDIVFTADTNTQNLIYAWDDLKMMAQAWRVS